MQSYRFLFGGVGVRLRRSAGTIVELKADAGDGRELVDKALISLAQLAGLVGEKITLKVINSEPDIFQFGDLMANIIRERMELYSSTASDESLVSQHVPYYPILFELHEIMSGYSAKTESFKIDMQDRLPNGVFYFQGSTGAFSAMLDFDAGIVAVPVAERLASLSEFGIDETMIDSEANIDSLELMFKLKDDIKVVLDERHLGSGFIRHYGRYGQFQYTTGILRLPFRNSKMRTATFISSDKKTVVGVVLGLPLMFSGVDYGFGSAVIERYIPGAIVLVWDVSNDVGPQLKEAFCTSQFMQGVVQYLLSNERDDQVAIYDLLAKIDEFDTLSSASDDESTDSKGESPDGSCSLF